MFLRVAVLVFLSGPAANSPATSDVPPPPLIEVPAPVVAETLQVRRKKLSLEEIIERSIEGEKTKLAGRSSMVYTGNGRSVVEFRRKKEIIDFVSRTYASDDGFERIVELGERTETYRREDDAWVLDPDDTQDGDGFDVSDGGVNDFANLPVYLESTHEFSYELLDRFVQTDRVIFKVAFRPKSDFKPLPRGILYVDTDRYRIIHEEFAFDRNPFPLLIRDLKRFSRQWEELPTGEWVWTKVRGEVELRADPFGRIPRRVTFAFERTDFAFDVPYDESVFGER